jgi:hypothetical protein
MEPRFAFSFLTARTAGEFEIQNVLNRKNVNDQFSIPPTIRIALLPRANSAKLVSPAATPWENVPTKNLSPEWALLPPTISHRQGKGGLLVIGS